MTNDSILQDWLDTLCPAGVVYLRYTSWGEKHWTGYGFSTKTAAAEWAFQVARERGVTARQEDNGYWYVPAKGGA